MAVARNQRAALKIAVVYGGREYPTPNRSLWFPVQEEEYYEG
jgi:hypothetical protein